MFSGLRAVISDSVSVGVVDQNQQVVLQPLPDRQIGADRLQLAGPADLDPGRPAVLEDNRWARASRSP